MIPRFHYGQSLRVKRSAIEGAISRVLETPRRESCGLLIGRCEETWIYVDTFAFCANIALHPEMDFIIAPDDQRSVVDGLGEPDRVVGIFHSHRGPPAPSPGDLVNMAIHDLAWLIIGETSRGALADVVCAAYCFSNDLKTAHEIVIHRG